MERQHGVRGNEWVLPGVLSSGSCLGRGGSSPGPQGARSTAVSQCPCVTASSPTAPVTSGAGRHPSLTRVSPCPPLCPRAPPRQARVDQASGGHRLSALSLLLAPNTQRVPGCLPARPLPARLLPGEGLPARPCAPGPAPYVLLGLVAQAWQALRTPASTPPPPGLALPRPPLKPSYVSKQMNMPSWAPSSSRRWCESSWAKG